MSTITGDYTFLQTPPPSSSSPNPHPTKHPFHHTPVSPPQAYRKPLGKYDEVWAHFPEVTNRLPFCQQGPLTGSLPAALSVLPQVEDIVDSGRTAAQLLQHYQEAGAASVKLVSLLSKPSRREVQVEPDYCCFDVPDYFVVGFGLDYNELYRSLPYIGVLKPECYSS